MFDEAEIELRYMPYDEYKAGVICNAHPITKEFSLSSEDALYALPSFVDVQNNGQNVSLKHSVDYSNTTVDYYEYSDLDTISWTQNSLDSTVEREIPVRLYSEDKRIYSTEKNITETSIDNQIITVDVDPTQNTSTISTSNTSFATVDYSHSFGYIEENKNDIVSIRSLDDESISMYSGYPVVEYEVIRDEFTVDIDSPTVVEQEDYYIVVENANGTEVIIVRTVDGGAFSVDAQSVSMSCNNSREIFFVGYVPNDLPAQEVAQTAYNRGSWRRTFVSND
jgi:hypothetical protein